MQVPAVVVVVGSPSCDVDFGGDRAWLARSRSLLIVISSSYLSSDSLSACETTLTPNVNFHVVISHMIRLYLNIYREHIAHIKLLQLMSKQL
jgi:hypothetical protein